MEKLTKVISVCYIGHNICVVMLRCLYCSQKANRMIPHNLNLKDVIIRMTLAFVIIITGWLLNTTMLFPVGMILTVSALAGYCPIYQLLGKTSHQEN